MSSLPIAIGTFEGFQVPGSLAQQNNNPGNLVYSPWESAYGGESNGAGGFASFPDASSGYAALQARLSQLESQGASISDVVNAWAGPQYPGNTQASADNYTNFLAQQTGLDPNTPLSQALASQGSMSNFGFTSTPQSKSINSSLTSVNPIKQLENWIISNAERFSTGIIGLIAIAGAIYLFKPTQTVITKAASNVKEAASALAVAG